MKIVRLIEPNILYQETYEELIAEFRVNQVPLTPGILKTEYSNFGDLVEKLRNYSQGINLVGKMVRNKNYWLVTDENEIVGASNLRLMLTDFLRQVGGHIGYGVRPSAWGKGYGTLLLSETLKKASEEGIDEVLVTCDKSNIASAKVILNNGGVFDSEDRIDGFDDIIQRYWIRLK